MTENQLNCMSYCMSNETDQAVPPPASAMPRPGMTSPEWETLVPLSRCGVRSTLEMAIHEGYELVLVTAGSPADHPDRGISTYLGSMTSGSFSEEACACTWTADKKHPSLTMRFGTASLDQNSFMHVRPRGHRSRRIEGPACGQGALAPSASSSASMGYTGHRRLPDSLGTWQRGAASRLVSSTLRCLAGNGAMKTSVLW